MEILRLSLREVAKILNYSDLRSVRRWCKNNGVMVLSDVGAKNKYVILKEFEIARLRSVANYLRSKHGEKNWLTVFDRFTNQNVERVIEEETKKVNSSSKGTERNTKREVKGENEKRFLDDLRKSLSDA